MNLAAIMAAYNKLTVIHWLVVKIESLFPGKGAGPSKLDIVLNTVQQGAADTVTAANEIENTKALVTATVSGLNKTGWPDPASLPPLPNFVNPTGLDKATADSLNLG